MSRQKRWKFATVLSFALSSNANQGIRKSELRIANQRYKVEKSDRVQPGIGFVSGVSGEYSFPVNDSVDLVLYGGVLAKTFAQKQLNELRLFASFGARHHTSWGRIGLHATIDKLALANQPYSYGWGLQLDTNLMLTEDSSLWSSLSCSFRRHNKSWFNTDLPIKDGHFCAFDGYLQYQFTQVVSSRLIGGLARNRVGTQFQNANSWTGGIGLLAEMPDSYDIYIESLYSELAYQTTGPHRKEARHDRRFDFNAELSQRHVTFYGFSPSLRYTYTFVDSNNPLHTYDAHGASLTLRRTY